MSAGDWIEWCKGLTRKRAILQVSARLHMRPTDAAGSFMLLMEWLDDNIETFDAHGNARVTLGPLLSSSFDELVGVSGYMDALIEARWARVEGDELIFVEAQKHIGTTAKQRALGRKRVQTFRAGIVNAPVTLAALPQNRTEQKKKYIAPPAAARSDPLFEALCRIQGSDYKALTKPERSKLNAARKEIIAATPGVTALEIERRAIKLARLWPNAKVTANSLSTHWSECEVRDQLPPGQQPIPEPAEWRRRMRAERPGWLGHEDGRINQPWSKLARLDQQTITQVLTATAS